MWFVTWKSPAWLVCKPKFDDLRFVLLFIVCNSWISSHHNAVSICRLLYLWTLSLLWAGWCMWWDIASTTIHILSGDLNIELHTTATAETWVLCHWLLLIGIKLGQNHVYGGAIMSIQYFIMLDLLANSTSAEESDLLYVYCYFHTGTFYRSFDLTIFTPYWLFIASGLPLYILSITYLLTGNSIVGLAVSTFIL